MSTNKLFASCGEELKVHEWSSGKSLYSLSSPSTFFKNISWSISGQNLLAIPVNNKPRLIRSITEGDGINFKANTLEEIERADVGLFSRNLEHLATFGTGEGDIYVVDIFTSQIVKTFIKLPSPIAFLDYAPKDTLLAGGCKNGQIFLYDSPENVCASFVVPCSNTLSSMLFHPTRESYLVAASKKGVVAIWDVQTNSVQFAVNDHNDSVTDMAISATEELLTTVGADKSVYIYDLRSKDIVFNKIFSSELSAVACSLYGEEFAIGTIQGRILFIDKRQPNYITSSIDAQRGSIKGIRFCNDLAMEENYKMKQLMYDPILADDESTAKQLSSIESDMKTQASGDFFPDDRPMVSRIPGGMDDILNINIVSDQFLRQVSEDVGDVQKSILHIEKSNLLAIEHEISIVNKNILRTFMEEINSQFLKIRMAISREFCRIEQSNNKRWQEFNATLLKLAGCEDTRRGSENCLSEILSNESHHTLGSKPESLYSPTKTKITAYTYQN